MKKLDPKAVVKRVIELHGGPDVFFELSHQRLKDFNAIWEQDAEKIGRALRVHLAVEHFLTVYLAFTNPRLGSADDARLSFRQKVELLPEGVDMISSLKPGLRRLNVIRNRMAHRLRVDVNDEDRDVLLSNEWFDASRNEDAQHEGREVSHGPLQVVEEFGLFAAGMLDAACDPNADLWGQAIHDVGIDAE